MYKWTTKAGNRVLINRMSDAHLMNTIRLCVRNAERSLVCVPEPLSIATPILDAIDSTTYGLPEASEDATYHDYLHRAFESLLGQAMKRGLCTERYPDKYHGRYVSRAATFDLHTP
jgi:hypothetical protein